jgi:hypothetical protein
MVPGSIFTPIPPELASDVVQFGQWCMAPAIGSQFTNGMHLYQSWLENIVEEAKRV